MTTDITLIASDNTEIRVRPAVARMSATISNILDDICDDTAGSATIPLPGVDGRTLSRVLQWCDQHSGLPADAVRSEAYPQLRNRSGGLAEPEEAASPARGRDPRMFEGDHFNPSHDPDDAAHQLLLRSHWNQQFCRALELAQPNGVEFLRVWKASDYLDIQLLLDVASRYFGESLKGMTAEEIRARWGIANDYTEDEVRRISLENTWCSADPADPAEPRC